MIQWNHNYKAVLNNFLNPLILLLLLNLNYLFELLFKSSSLGPRSLNIFSAIMGASLVAQRLRTLAWQWSRRGFDPWVRNVPWRSKWQPLWYSCLETSVDRGAWRATVHKVATVRHDWYAPCTAIIGNSDLANQWNILQLTDCSLSIWITEAVCLLWSIWLDHSLSKRLL